MSFNGNEMITCLLIEANEIPIHTYYNGNFIKVERSVAIYNSFYTKLDFDYVHVLGITLQKQSCFLK